MSTKHPYDPEDIESLMLNKEFSELYPEEQKFVLEHLESADEYESMRRTLFDIQHNARSGKWLEPDSSIRKNLLAEFSREQKKGFSVWLNNLFAFPAVTWYRQPAFRYALIGAAMLAGVIFWIGSGTGVKTLADNTKPESNQKDQKEAHTMDSAAVMPADNTVHEIETPDTESITKSLAIEDLNFADDAQPNAHAEVKEALVISDQSVLSPAPANSFDWSEEMKSETEAEFFSDDMDRHAGNAATTSTSIKKDGITLQESFAKTPNQDLVAPATEVKDLVDLLFTAL